MKPGPRPLRTAHRPATTVRQRTRALRGWLLVILFSCMVSQSSGQQGYVDREHRIKAAYVYNFAKYVRWPEHAYDQATFDIGIIGESPIEQHLIKLSRSKSVHGRRLRIIPLKLDEPFPFCHIVFLTGGFDDPLLPSALSRLKQGPTLLICEGEELSRGGAIISFYNEDNRVRFLINTTHAQNADLSISSKLLRLGRVVN